ncbi:MAG: TetR/AcrR family transcriptional regulator [Candidatus Acidiferrales bacterium]
MRIEVLARDLGVSKGSFYWHFRDRGELLERMLERWEHEELKWTDAEDNTGPATRWARIVAKTADPERIRSEVALRGWARCDSHVAARVAAVERKKAVLIARVLRDVGFTLSAADAWSEIVLMVCLGWLDRATRDRAFLAASRGLGEFLSDVILAASSGASPLNAEYPH